MKILNFLKNIIKSKKDKSSGSCETITVIEPIKNQDQSKNNDAYLGLGTYKKPLVLKGIPYGVGGAGGSTPRTITGYGECGKR